ncbi:FAD-dependent oxidoreductase [Skeletonema marinoi]|uniref:FAD-dependent oxidoreductase n=1 Tax=Skeletonema marinoi TaxID=267567 RepID=A0AAD8XU49_9STRA|nr:FAD-dependent oxidoreductase [Skeletonema marinoi]
MTVLTAAACSLFLITFGADAAAGEGWRADLPWAVLESKLSTSASLIDTGFKDYASECTPEFVNFRSPIRSTFALINQPSGLCLPHLACGYDRCNPRPSANHTYDLHAQDILAMAQEVAVPDAFNPALQDSYFNDPSNPSLDLPSKVLHPVDASDVVAVIQFAKEHSLELSVKNSGHSWQGASSKKNTLLVNMNRYTCYAPTGITNCDAQSLGIAIKDNLSDQPCHLSVAKNKPAVIRVGGGENWDKTYRAVKDANEAGGLYHIVGGSSGSVSPMGWTFQGGLSGSWGTRYGLGADQVVQIEMVLPNGFHVKFGPTEWKDASAEGFTVPRTIGVTGLCRTNPEERDEEKWVWGDCPNDFDVDFMDLWYAIRGGGGGTWGVVLSMHLQLHDYVPRVDYPASSSEECSATVFTADSSLFMHPLSDPLNVEFVATYMMTPSVLNVTVEQSRACGSPGIIYNMPQCYGEEAISQAWITFLQMKNITGGTECLERNPRGGLPSSSPLGSRFEGQIADLPSPGIAAGAVNGVLVPKAWVEKVGVQSANDLFGISKFGLPYLWANYYAFGSAAVTSDQANSVSQAHRDAGIMILLFDTESETFWRDIAPEMFDLKDKTKFPPIFGSNHAATGMTGPRKDDWTKPCPGNWTFEERLAGCVSFQEAIYGTETLKRLEAIKKVVDPKNMFACNNCIRATEENEEEAADQEEVPTQEDKDDGVAVKEEDVGSTSSYPRNSFLAIAMMIGAAVNCFVY